MHQQRDYLWSSDLDIAQLPAMSMCMLKLDDGIQAPTQFQDISGPQLQMRLLYNPGKWLVCRNDVHCMRYA